MLEGSAQKSELIPPFPTGWVKRRWPRLVQELPVLKSASRNRVRAGNSVRIVPALLVAFSTSADIVIPNVSLIVNVGGSSAVRPSQLPAVYKGPDKVSSVNYRTIA